MTTPEIIRQCRKVASLPSGSVFAVLATLFLLIRLTVRLKDPSDPPVS